MNLINKLNFALLEIAKQYDGCCYLNLSGRERQIVTALEDANYLEAPVQGEIKLKTLTLTEKPKLPWRVEYNQRCEEWDPKSCPRVVSDDGKFICGIPQSDDVHHPGEYDKKADMIAHLIVNSVNKNV